MKITFLGTAGGRILIMAQLRASGGWILDMDGERIHVDPEQENTSGNAGRGLEKRAK